MVPTPPDPTRRTLAFGSEDPILEEVASVKDQVYEIGLEASFEKMRDQSVDGNSSRNVLISFVRFLSLGKGYLVELEARYQHRCSEKAPESLTSAAEPGMCRYGG
jgi:hypothetical protein